MCAISAEGMHKKEHVNTKLLYWERVTKLLHITIANALATKMEI